MKKINTQRVLLITLVGVAFFGFLLWSIQQYQIDAETLASGEQSNNKIFQKNSMIQVGAPLMNASIKSPVTISGQANTITLAKLVYIKIKDKNNLTLASATTKTQEAQKLSPFSIQLKYKKPSTSKGTIEIYQIAPEDKAEIYKITISVNFTD